MASVDMASLNGTDDALQRKIIDLPQEAINAKEEALAEVAKLLSLPENLESIASLRAEYAQKKQANDAQLSTSVNTQVEEGRVALSLLAASQSTLEQLRSNFETIDCLCAECSSLIENHDVINKLNTALHALESTISTVDRVTAIP
ncbi:hypothetical protein CYMTET_9670, partial [Cymbomonas tetramitiformis]